MAAENGRGVFILGMHRSGTSAVTRAVSLLGPPLGEDAGLKDASSRNPRGFWEMGELSSFNEELLRVLGGTWSAPPVLRSGWATSPELSSMREEGKAIFERLHATSQWVWKDPRNCILLPFWVDTVEVPAVVVLVHRHPFEIWRSLDDRDGFSKALAMALWERYLRQALTACRGLPVMVTRYGDLLDDPGRWSSEVRDFLEAQGVTCENGDPAELGSFLDRDLRHSRAEDAEVLEDPDVSEEQRRLFASLERLIGAHPRFEPEVAEETPWAESLLAERRRADLRIEPMRRELKLLDKELRVASGQVELGRSRLAKSQGRLEDSRQALDRQRGALTALEASWSWRLTRPLRWLGSRFGRGAT